MKPPGAWKYAFYLLWFSLWCIAALILFSRGFFLSRRALPDVSECQYLEDFNCEYRSPNDTVLPCSVDDNIAAILRRTDSPHVCGPDKTKVILVVVDAFRYDFAEYNDTLKRPLAYQNKLPVIKTLLESPEKTRLFKFLADPPTTTFQRLKGLMTGSLPTFIDAGANFATAEIVEDNLIDQVLLGGGKAVLLGDDTWLRLFPGRWLRTHAQYSFHTWDLDTVDREVDSQIYSELSRTDWQLLVAHYLGVDHAGHRYGPLHPEMTRKLRELNNRLERLTQEMPKDALLCVIGDHGMTDTGDHGGESNLETTATLLLHSPSGLAWRSETGASVRQTDLASTLSIAMGRISPSPSLGLVQPAALPSKLEQAWRKTLLSTVSNLDQVMRYIERYASESQELDTVRLHEAGLPYKELRSRAVDVVTIEQFHEYYADVRGFVDSIREVCRTAWVEFDSLGMMRGCLILFMAIFLNYLLLEGVPTASLTPIFRSTFVACAYISTVAAALLALVLRFLQITDDLEHSILLGSGLSATAVMATLVVQHWGSIAERWYSAKDFVTHERLSRAALVASAMALLSNSYVIEEAGVCVWLCVSVLALAVRAAGAPRAALLFWCGIGVSLLATRPFRACREEQGDCWSVVGAGESGAGSRAGALLAMLSLGAVAAAGRHWSSPSEVLWRHAPGAAAVCVCGHWTAGWGGAGGARRARTLALCSWAVLAMLLLMLLVKPANARVTLVRLAIILHTACALTLGPSASTPAALMLLAAALTLNLFAEVRKHLVAKSDSCRNSETAAAVTWCLLATYWLYATGHHATFAHIRWAAAFHVGELATENFLPRVVSAAFILLNTFGGHFMFGVTSPLLVLWTGRASDSEDSRRPLSTVFSVCLKFQLCFAIRLLGCMLAATIHCRHLMVWSVFAPKLMYEAGSAVFALAGTCVGFLVVMRTWTEKAARTHNS